jgi:hypothetical protein
MFYFGRNGFVLAEFELTELFYFMFKGINYWHK